MSAIYPTPSMIGDGHGTAEGLVAIDLGSSSGRIHLGRVSDGRLETQEVYRFANGPMRIGERWYWDILRILDEVQSGLQRAAEAAGGARLTIGIDSFGCDYCLLDDAGALMALPRHHRDPRTRGAYDEIYKAISRRDLYRRTGAMEIEINTLGQLIVERREQPWLQHHARSLLFMPDFLAWALTGRRFNEITIASTSQLVDPSTRGWAFDVAERLGVPTRVFCPIVEPGTIVGPIAPSLRKALRLPENSALAAVSSHDTSAAVAATPLEDGSAFISLGTWSLLGQETPAPVLTDAARRENFTNECGAGRTIVFHKILAGLWLLQECRRRWRDSQPGLDYEAIHAAAEASAPLRHVFDVEDARFIAPQDMTGAFAAWFAERGLSGPSGVGETARAIYDSLALCYRVAIAALEQIVEAPVRVIHIVGGGARARLLCQNVADATARVVLAGPVEAAVAGNMLGQLMARGELSDLAHCRDLIRRSTPIERYEPRSAAVWNDAGVRLLETRGR